MCHGVIHRLLPGATIIDTTHAVEAYNVLQAAVILADATPYLPIGVHVAIVDPGVGTDRRAVAIACENENAYVGPDNGVLMLAANRDRVVSAFELPVPKEAKLGATFAGRDVFAPVAARLAAGVPPSQLGRSLEASTLATLSVPTPTADAGGLRVVVLSTDSFGTLQLGCSRNELLAIGTGERVLVSTAHGRGAATIARTFADVACGELLVYEDSFQHLAAAVREGSAAALLGASAGDIVSLDPL